MRIGEEEAARSLETMQAARIELARRARWSMGRHAISGLLMGLLVASYALPGGWPILGVVLCMLAVAVVIDHDANRDGLVVSGSRAGPTRRLTIGLGLVAILALGIAVFLRQRLGIAWAPVPFGVIVALVCTAGSMRWEQLYREELAGVEGRN
ncbi:hypothetical protein [Sphingomonas xinjiangensis]|uniref:Uncharacterized protein n=1 Tax=Sphingomonas xinjiangensis TaxID=643568 RepID=A0A840YDV9_9SPHN|nr:hypothetical protein [Sphingomonas xinjiangensis]MBB5711607.1 hypothetical protein [Sphingomonas xinjiangensis]